MSARLGLGGGDDLILRYDYYNCRQWMDGPTDMHSACARNVRMKFICKHVWRWGESFCRAERDHEIPFTDSRKEAGAKKGRASGDFGEKMSARGGRGR